MAFPGTCKQVGVLLLAAALTGCAVQHYRAVPINPAATAARLEARTLTDRGLIAFLRANVKPAPAAWPPRAWDLTLLADTALYYSPAMAMAQDQAELASAAVVTAGARPNPTLSVQPGIPSPYSFSLDWAIPIQTHNKRGLQVVQAQRLNTAARWKLAQTAWNTRSAVRAALTNLFAAEIGQRQNRALLQVEVARVRLLRQQFAAGEISRPLVDTARADEDATRLSVQQQATAVSRAHAALAAAVGVPETALAGVKLSWPQWSAPPAPRSLSGAAIRRAAVIDRLDVRQALANYQASQAALQLEIARQYPDFNIGPGYDYGEGHSYFTVGLSVTLPVFNRNQGPIVQAEARRKIAAAALMQTQAAAIAAGDEAWAAYRGAYAEWRVAQAMVASEQARVRSAQAARQAGETGPLALNSAELLRATARLASEQAHARVQQALGQLENAVERPLEKGDPGALAPGEILLQRPSPAVPARQAGGVAKPRRAPRHSMELKP